MAAGLLGDRRDLGLRLLLIDRPAAEFLQQDRGSHPHRRQQQHQHQRAEQHAGDIRGDRCGGPLCQQTGDGAAGAQRLAGGPQLLQHSPLQGVCLPGEDRVEQGAGRRWQQQGAGGPQRHGAAPVEQQDQPRQQQRRSRQPVAVAEEPLQQLGQQIQQDGLDAAAAHQDAQGQHQQNGAPHLPADGPLLRLSSLGSTGAGAAAALFCSCFLLC